MAVDYIERHLERELKTLDAQLEEGRISPADYELAVRDLEKEARDEYRAYREERIADLDNEMGWG